LILIECLRRENFINYNNILNIFYNEEDDSVIVVIDLFFGILIINVNLSISIRLSKGSSTYYYEVIIRPILLDLIYRRLGYISEARVKVFVSGLAEGLKLLSNINYRTSKCDYCIIGKIRILSYSRR
jgi:hypothetical protein